MKVYQKIFIFLLVLVSFQFFDARFINMSVVNYSVYCTLFCAIMISVPFLLVKNEGFVLSIKLILISIVISILMANIYWDQNFKESIQETIPYLLWIFFFFLLHINVPVSTIERIVLFYGVLYVILFFFQLSQSPTVLFGRSLWGDEFSVDRGTVRIIFPGAGIFILSVLIAINKLTSQAKGRLFWISMMILGIVIPILQVTRQFIVGILLIYFFHFMKGRDIFKKASVVLILLGVFFYIRYLDSPIISGLKEAASEDFKQGGEYVRVLAGKYFLTEFSPSNVNMVFGNGAPYWGLSFYGIYIENLAEEKGYFLSDVGIIGMYAMFGALAVIGYIMIWVKSITIPLPKKYYYLKYYLWYLLFTSFTWFSVYHYHYLISTVFVLYLYQKIYLENKETKVVDEA